MRNYTLHRTRPSIFGLVRAGFLIKQRDLHAPPETRLPRSSYNFSRYIYRQERLNFSLYLGAATEAELKWILPSADVGDVQEAFRGGIDKLVEILDSAVQSPRSLQTSFLVLPHHNIYILVYLFFAVVLLTY